MFLFEAVKANRAPFMHLSKWERKFRCIWYNLDSLPGFQSWAQVRVDT